MLKAAEVTGEVRDCWWWWAQLLLKMVAMSLQLCELRLSRLKLLLESLAVTLNLQVAAVNCRRKLLDSQSRWLFIAVSA